MAGSIDVRGSHPQCLAAVAALAVILAVAGCSGRSAKAVAHLNGNASASAAGGLTPAQGDAAMVAFTRCMRAHGVSMSDPFHRPGHQGLTLDLPSRTQANNVGYAACESIIAPLVQAKEAGAVAQVSGELPALIRYAQCMRAHDINMLDPRPDGTLSLGTVAGISSDYGRGSPQFSAADTACRHLLPADVHDDGTGP
jgi:hypothetical protein